ncbi:MAG: hypothetical protein AAB966_01925 [Patescibacteria group bacterium]
MDTIKLSRYTKALVENYLKVKTKAPPDESGRISVSQTVSFFAIAYERIRNLVEYREAHLMRRAAIERILKRRLALNPEGKGEAENLVRELLWARYFPNESLGLEDVEEIQKLIDTSLTIKTKAQEEASQSKRSYIGEFIIQLLTCEIEEYLSPEEAQKSSLFVFFIFQVLKEKMKVDNISEQEKDSAFYVAVEQAYSKSDLPYLRHHIYLLAHEPLSRTTHEHILSVVSHVVEYFEEVDSIIKNKYSERMRKFVSRQIAPFHILFEVLRRRGKETLQVLENKEYLEKDVDFFCQQKYSQTQSRFQALAFKAILYILLTKVIFAFIIEYPVSIYLYGETDYSSLAINSLFPPVLMFLIVTFTRTPNANNTKRIFNRIVDLIDADKSFETTVSYRFKGKPKKQSVLVFSFTILYLALFFFTFGAVHRVLKLLGYHFASEIIFVFFVSLVSFFGYRIRQTAKEYQLQEKETFFRPFIDLFSVPILATGKFLSRGLSKINIFTVVFDFIFEAPFKLVIEVVEEWISFVRAKRDDIV